MSVDFGPLRQVTKAIWSLGDSSAFAELLEPAALNLINACGIAPDRQLLDIGTGNGNCAIAARRGGAIVVASDVSPAVLKLGRARAKALGLEITWTDADAEDLPFEDCRFDIVTSAFGAIFACQPSRAASEMFRVLAPSGTLAMANWTPESFSSQAMRIVSKRIDSLISASPTLGFATPPSPFLWGDETILRSRFLPMSDDIAVTRCNLVWKLDCFEALQAVFESHGGGFLARQLLPADIYREQLQELKALVAKWNQDTGGRVLIPNDYLLVLARKR